MERIKSIEEIESLINLLEDPTRFITTEDREEIAHYIRFSAPFKVIRDLEEPVFDVITKCEDIEVFTQETHDARNALARLYGYQILQLI